MKKAFAVLVLSAVFCMLTVTGNSEIASGIWGTCPWVIDDEGTLTISAGVGTGLTVFTHAPWYEHKDEIKKVVTSGTVILPEQCVEMFNYHSEMTSIDVSGFDSSNVVSFDGMFRGCSGLTSLNVSMFVTTKLKYTCSMFEGCSGLKSLNVGFDTSKVETMYDMFKGCSSLTNLDLSSFNTSRVEAMDGMFYGCSGLTSLDVSRFDTSKVTAMYDMFRGCSGLTSLDVIGFDTSHVDRMYNMFLGCSGLKSLSVSGFNTSLVENMDSMFASCSGLTSLDLSRFNTSRVKNMGYMFFGCSGLTSLDVSGFDTSKLTSMSHMFSNCSSLTNLNLSSFNTSNVTDMSHMFSGCSSLTALNVSSFNASKVQDMPYMFSNCQSLTSLDLSGFNASSPYMYEMFSDCSNLSYLDISGFDTSRITYSSIVGLFLRCNALATIRVGSATATKTFLSRLPAREINGHKDWYSDEDDGNWYTVEEIEKNRVGIADTYTKEPGSSQININEFEFRLVDSTRYGFEITKYIGQRANVIIPVAYSGGAVIGIGDNAFEDCTTLMNVKVSGVVERIGSNVFSGCTNLNTIQIGLNVETIASPFNNCPSLQTITVAEENLAFRSKDGVLFKLVDKPLDKLELFCYPAGKAAIQYNIPPETAAVGEGAFCSCSALQTVHIPMSVDRIEDNAFINRNEGFTIEGYSGTKAEEFAENYSIPFSSLGAYPLKTYMKSKTTDYNPDLASFLMSIAHNAYNDDDDYPVNLEESFSKLELMYPKYFNYYEDALDSRYPHDAVAYGLGFTWVDGKPVIMVAIRGSDGAIGSPLPNDWASNFNLGGGGAGDHKGFRLAADDLLFYLDAYVLTHVTTGTKPIFFVTGHSRGAGVGNIVAKDLTDKYGKGQVYAYNFACPDSVKRYFGVSLSAITGAYNNIFNINHAPDIVSLVPGTLADLTDFIHVTSVLEEILKEFGVSKSEFLDEGETLSDFFLSKVSIWGKYGRSFWFSEDWDDIMKTSIVSAISNQIKSAADCKENIEWAHTSETYVNYLSRRLPLSRYKTYSEYIEKVYVFNQIETVFEYASEQFATVVPTTTNNIVTNLTSTKTVITLPKSIANTRSVLTRTAEGMETNLLSRAMENDTITVLCRSAFGENNTVEAIAIPACYLTIEEEAFARCGNLKKVVVFGKNTAFGPNAIPEGCTVYCLKESEAETYAAENELTVKYLDVNRMTLPAALKTIQQSAFANSGIECIILPDTGVTVENNAFDSCDHLNMIIADGDGSAVLSMEAFSNPNEVLIFAPVESNAWKDAENAGMVALDVHLLDETQ